MFKRPFNYNPPAPQGFTVEELKAMADFLSKHGKPDKLYSYTDLQAINKLPIGEMA